MSTPFVPGLSNSMNGFHLSLILHLTLVVSSLQRPEVS